jgi:hypothetical protein
MNKKFTLEDDTIIRSYYPKYGAFHCAKELNFKFNENDIRGYCSRKKIQRMKKFDLNSFKNVSSPQMAYFLGLLWADGYAHKNGTNINLEVVKDDGLIFYQIIKELGDFGVWERTRKNKTRSMMSICINSTEITKYFFEMDYGQKSKVSPTKILKTIPEYLHRYFWLGFLDGDGCFYTKLRLCQLSFSGALDQDWSELKNFLEKAGCKSGVTKTFPKEGKTHKCSSLRLSSRFDIVKIGNILYQSIEQDGIGLPRKYNKYLEIKSKAVNSRTLNKE